jgi:putative ABC transport system substrate-binding protein
MKRREFMAVLCGAAAWPSAGRAQQAAMPVVGFLRSTPAEPFGNLVNAFREGLRETVFVEGHNVSVEYRYADDDVSRLPRLASDLMERKAAVIVGNLSAVRAVRAVSGTVPVVFVMGDDPVRRGLVQSLNRPGGSTTGVTFLGGGALNVKRLEMLHEATPPGRSIGVLIDPEFGDDDTELPNVEAAARALRRKLVIVRASRHELDAAFERVAQARAGALLVSGSPAFTSRRHELVALAARHRMPASYDQRTFVEIGGLMSYGADFPGAYRRAGVYVGRILSGDDPGDLPVVQPATFQLAVNLKTAKALGITLPATLLARADEVIE